MYNIQHLEINFIRYRVIDYILDNIPDDTSDDTSIHYYIFAIVILWYYSISSRYQYMDGFWEASNEFAEEANVDSIMLYFDQATGWLSNKRQGYILIADNVANQAFTLTYSRSWSLSPFKYGLKGSIIFDDDQIWEKDISIDIDINKNKMIIRHDKTVYAVLHKSID